MTINLEAPRSFAEMSDAQLRYLASLLVAGQTEEQIKIKCFIRFSGIKLVSSNGDTYYFRKKGIKGNFTLKNDEVSYFAKKFDFLTTKYRGIRPVQKIGKYKAADQLLRNTRFEQYLSAENHYQAYIFTKQDNHLAKLMATLYIDGEKYDSKKVDKAAAYFVSKASAEEKLITVMWMMGIKEHFLKQFKYLFVKNTATDQEEEQPAAAPDMLEIMTTQIRMLTGGDITKNMDVLKSNTWDALIEIDKKCEEYKKLKKDV